MATTPTRYELGESTTGTPLVFSGDLSANRTSQIVAVPSGTTRATFLGGWTGTDTPTGVIKLRKMATSASTSGVDCDGQAGLGPAGTADSLAIEGVELDGWPYVQVYYTRTSGGTGDVFTDADRTAGSLPVLIFT